MIFLKYILLFSFISLFTTIQESEEIFWINFKASGNIKII